MKRCYTAMMPTTATIGVSVFEIPTKQKQKDCATCFEITEHASTGKVTYCCLTLLCERFITRDYFSTNTSQSEQ